jgi:hypothetical protein
MSSSYEQFWAACDPYDAFLSKEEKEKYETEVLANHPEYLEEKAKHNNGQKATLVVDVCDIMALSMFFTAYEDEVKEDGLEQFADRIHRLANAYENDRRREEKKSK